MLKKAVQNLSPILYPKNGRNMTNCISIHVNQHFITVLKPVNAFLQHLKKCRPMGTFSTPFQFVAFSNQWGTHC